MAFPALYLYSLNATRSSITLTSQYTHHSWNLQQLRRLQSLVQRAELGMQRSVARLFYVGGYVSHPSVLDTSGTFININPSESELFNLRADNTVVCQFPFLFFSFILIYR
jgi:hypothetical protein